MKLSRFRVDEKVGQEGIWIEVGEGLRIRIAHSRNPHYLKMIRKLGRPYRSQVASGRMVSDDVWEGIAREAAARHILLGWEGLQDDDGNEVVYSVEEALRVFEEYPEFLETVTTFAGDRAMFEVEQEEETEGN